MGSEWGRSRDGGGSAQVFETMLPQDEIDGLCLQCGVIERQRKLDLGVFVRAMVISAGTPEGAYQVGIVRSYLQCEVPRVAGPAFDRWFDEPRDLYARIARLRACEAYAVQFVIRLKDNWKPKVDYSARGVA
jgi:hypothetical protein